MELSSSFAEVVIIVYLDTIKEKKYISVNKFKIKSNQMGKKNKEKSAAVFR